MTLILILKLLPIFWGAEALLAPVYRLMPSGADVPNAPIEALATEFHDCQSEIEETVEYLNGEVERLEGLEFHLQYLKDEPEDWFTDSKVDLQKLETMLTNHQ